MSSSTPGKCTWNKLGRAVGVARDDGLRLVTCRKRVNPGSPFVATSQNMARTCVHSNAPRITRRVTMKVSKGDLIEG